MQLEYKLEKPPKYHYEDTGVGTWKTYEFENGVKYKEYTSHLKFGDQPFVSIKSGIDPETGKMAMAEGVIAVGQRAKGFLAIGQFASGWISVGQFVTARVAGIGQFCIAPLAVGQFSIAVAAVAQIGIVGTGFLQAGIAFFGGTGQAVVDVAKNLF